SGYAVRLVDAGECTFEACGGSPTGYWSVSSAMGSEKGSICEANSVSTENPIMQYCASASFAAISATTDATLSITPGRSNQFFLSTCRSVNVTGTVPTSCLNSLETQDC